MSTSRIINVSLDVQKSYSLAQIGADLHAINCATSALDKDNFFLQECWIFSWWQTLPAPPLVYRFISDTNRLLGFAILGISGGSSERRKNILSLNQYGDNKYDQIWIEHNDIICVQEYKHVCREILLRHFASNKRANALVLSMVRAHDWQHPNLIKWSQDVSNGYLIDLARLVSEEKNVLQSLSRNRRSQVSRSLRFIEEQFGDIEAHYHSHNISQNVLDEIAHFHQVKWRSHEYGSGFDNPTFVAFHQNIASNASAHSYPLIIEYKAGDHTLGYLYFFVSGKKVDFYLSGINYSHTHNQYRPGLVMHTLAAEYFLQSGFHSYDFLAGESDYKKSLSNCEYQLARIEFRRNTVLNRIAFATRKVIKKSPILKRITKFLV